MKNKANKLIVALLAVLCLTVPGLVGSVETKAAEEDITNTYVTEEYDVADARAYFTGDTAPVCDTEGYIFAGWYAEDDTIEAGYFKGEPLTTITGYTGTKVQALFVEDDVLGVKAQLAVIDDDANTAIAEVTSDSETGKSNANIRFVTSVDTLKYQKVGVKVSYTYNGEVKNQDKATNKVYKQIIVADGNGEELDTTMVAPNEIFSVRSQYFKAYTMTGFPMDAFETELSVRAYWVTADGATVYGSDTPVVKTVQQGINHTYEANIDNMYYKVLETAVTTVGDTDTKTVTLLKDAEVSEDMVIDGNVKITNRKGANVTINRAATLTTNNVFSVSSGATLTIEGTTDRDSIVLDGRTAEHNQVIGVPMIHVVSGSNSTLTIINATLQNAKTETANRSGGIFAQNGRLTVNDVNFFGNSGTHGGAIRVAASVVVRIDDCLFGGTEEGQGNTGITDGGAIYTQSTDVEIEDTQFLNNTATRYGGAIGCNGAAKLKITNSKFAENKATGASGRGGAIFIPTGAQVTLTAKNGEDSTLASFENNVSQDTTYGGGAIYEQGSTTILTITGYEFKGNQALKTGGAICARGGNVTITGATFEGNYTTGASGHGGAVYIAAGVSVNADVDADITAANTYTDNHVKADDAEGDDVYIAK